MLLKFLFHWVVLEVISINITEIILIVLWFVSFLSWLGWFIGFPIYKKVKKEEVFEYGSPYALGLCIGACIMNLLNLFIKIAG